MRTTMTTLAALATAALLAVAAFSQQPQNFDAVQIKATNMSANFSMLEGQGGTIGVLHGPDGVFMVDTQFAPLSDRIAAAVKQITPQPIRFIVNTHVHGDHTGGNENFAKMGAFILSRDQLRFRLAHPAPAAAGKQAKAAPPAALPKITYDGPVTLHMNGEEIRLIPVRNAHTDGDTLIHFVNNDILMTGDFYRSLGYPNIDRGNGGTFDGMVAGLGLVIGTAGPATRIIPGHGPVVDRREVEAHRDLMLALRDKMLPLVRQGQTVEQVTAAKLTAEFDSKVREPGTTGDRFIGQLYAELKAVQ
jgi:cyclase